MLFLESVHIGKKLKIIEGNPFSQNWELKEININPDNDNFFMEDGILYSEDYKELIHVLNDKEIGDFIVPDNTEIIHSYSFSKKLYTDVTKQLKTITFGKNMRVVQKGAFSTTYLETVNMNEGLTYLDDEAFLSLPIKEMIIPNSVSFIGKSCFSQDYYLEKVRLPNTLETIPYSCFRGASSLKDIVIPCSVKRISGLAFMDSTTELTYEGTITEWELIEKEKEWTNNTMTINCSDGVLTV